MQQRQHALTTLRRSAAGDPPVERIVADALDIIQSLLDADHSAYGSLRAGEDSLLLTVGRGWEDGVIGRARLATDPTSLAGHTLGLGRPLIIEDLRFAPQFRPEPVLIAAGTRGLLLTTVRGQRGTSGLLGAFTSRRRLYSPEDGDFLRALSDVIAAALYREDWRQQIASRHPNRRAPPGGDSAPPEPSR